MFMIFGNKKGKQRRKTERKKLSKTKKYTNNERKRKTKQQKRTETKQQKWLAKKTVLKSRNDQMIMNIYIHTFGLLIIN